jgi:hypothetical protein
VRAVVLFLALAACGGDRVPSAQPIAFSHAIHAGEQKVPCVDCHVGAETSAHASLPALSRCLVCHMKPQGKQPNPREQVVRELAAKREPLRFVQVTRNAGHVHFSHSRTPRTSRWSRCRAATATATARGGPRRRPLPIPRSPA